MFLYLIVEMCSLYLQTPQYLFGQKTLANLSISLQIEDSSTTFGVLLVSHREISKRLGRTSLTEGVILYGLKYGTSMKAGNYTSISGGDQRERETLPFVTSSFITMCLMVCGFT